MDVFYCQVKNTPMFELTSLIKWFSNHYFNEEGDTSILCKCPAFRKELENTFIIQSNFFYNLSWDGTSVKSDLYSQKYFNDNVLVRDIKIGLCSLDFPKFIFLSEKSLHLSLIPAYLHNNNFVDNTITIPGSFDIGNHVRPLDLAFIFKQKCKITINEGDALMYVKFHTKEKINFKPFFYDQQMSEMVNSTLGLMNSSKYTKPLEWWYNLNSSSKRIKKYITLAKKNLFDGK